MDMAQAIEGGLVVQPGVLKTAEAKLADFIGGRVNPALTQNLTLELQTVPVNGRTEMLLRFKGDMVNANSALLAEQALLALRSHPAFASLWSADALPHAARPPELAGDEMYIRLPAISISQYAQLMQQVNAQGMLQTPAVTSATAHQSDCACTTCTPASLAAKAHASGCGCNACVTDMPSTTISQGEIAADRADRSAGVAV